MTIKVRASSSYQDGELGRAINFGEEFDVTIVRAFELVSHSVAYPVNAQAIDLMFEDMETEIDSLKKSIAKNKAKQE